MKILIRNKVFFFIIYIFTNLLVSVILLTLKNCEIAGIVLLLFSAITGTMFFLSELYYALKIGIYFLSLLLIVIAGYGLYFLIRLSPVINDFLSAGISITGVVFLYSLSIIYRFQERAADTLYEYIETANTVEDKTVNYKQYQKYCRREWYQSQSNWISNQSFPMTLVRILGLITCILIGILGLLGRGIPIFENEIFNHMLYLYFIAYGLIFFIAGFRFSAIPAFILWAMIFISYFIHLFVYDFVHPFLQYNVFTYAVITIVFALCIIPAVYYFKNQLMYSNVQMYERGEQCITVDLFVSEFLPIVDLDLMMQFSVILENYTKNPNDFIRLLKIYVKRINKKTSMLTGYIHNSQANRVTFYVYTNKYLSSDLEKEIRDKTQIFGFTLENVIYKNDPDWNEYKTQLNPNNIELCSIISRSYIEQLFMKGISFDKEYDIDFFVNFKDKNDPVNFEKEIKYFGFNLTYASYDEDNDCIDPGYKYYGEYKIKSFISHRRIEYLNKLLLDKSDDYGSLYLGEWEIN